MPRIYEALWVAEHWDPTVKNSKGQEVGGWIYDGEYVHPISESQYPEPTTTVKSPRGDDVVITNHKEPLINTPTRRTRLPKLPPRAERWRLIAQAGGTGVDGRLEMTTGKNIPRTRDTQ